MTCCVIRGSGMIRSHRHPSLSPPESLSHTNTFYNYLSDSDNKYFGEIHLTHPLSPPESLSHTNTFYHYLSDSDNKYFEEIHLTNKLRLNAPTISLVH